MISVDSLPVAPSAEPPHGTGRLLIGASPGWCAISVDGMKRGPTPLPAIDLVHPGSHVHPGCDSPTGKTKTDSIFIKDGATARHQLHDRLSAVMTDCSMSGQRQLIKTRRGW